MLNLCVSLLYFGLWKKQAVRWKVNTLDLILLGASEANEKLLNISTGEMNHSLPGPIQHEIAPIWDLQPFSAYVFYRFCVFSCLQPEPGEHSGQI